MTADNSEPLDGSDASRSLGRRAFMAGVAGLGAAAALSGGAFVSKTGDVWFDPWLGGEFTPVGTDAPASDTALSDDTTRHWLGPDLWGNRLQDWRYEDGRLVCLQGSSGHEVRTVAALTRELVTGDVPGHLRVAVGRAEHERSGGFCGFLVGVNEDLNYRARALAQRVSGTGGGLLCTYDADGEIRFRDHTSEARPLAFDELPAEPHGPSNPPAPTATDEVELRLDILPRGGGRFDLQLDAFDATTRELLAGATLQDVSETRLLGGISLVSSPPPKRLGTRWWFEGFETAGEKVREYPERTFGPIAGTQYSLADDVLKLTAQLMPVGGGDVTLEYRPENGTGGWQSGPTEPIESGYIARFRVEDWDATRDWEYRVVYEQPDGTTWEYPGTVTAEPVDEEVTIGLVNCVLACARPLEANAKPWSVLDRPQLGRYTPANFYFPHEELVANVGAHDPDLLVFAGDQLYENNPTRPERAIDPELDYLYKWYLWVWSFRDLTRDTPTVTLLDDHDVYQPNVWGDSGEQVSKSVSEASTTEHRNKYPSGGYVGTTQFVNRVQRIQAGHNPDPYDDDTIGDGIDVYYGSFEFGGVDIAVLEDRKFKSPPPRWDDATVRRELLGKPQERFLEEWADQTPDDGPALCLTQTCFAAAHTTPSGKPMSDHDTNGYPPGGRTRALRLLREANALVLSGDQHLGTLVRHGIDSRTDGVVQFTGPAGGARFQRWFEPGSLQNDTGHRHTGDFVDAFGNRFRMLAVANPDISFETFQGYHDRGAYLYDRRLKKEGYGIVRVDPDAREYRIECWPWDQDPRSDTTSQYAGWPYRLPFKQADGRRSD